MTDDTKVLYIVALVTLFIAAVSITAFPIFYAFRPWYRSHIGRSLMATGIGWALLVDLTLIFHFWDLDNIAARLWVHVVVFSYQAFATAYLTSGMVITNYINPYRKRQHERRLQAKARSSDPRRPWRWRVRFRRGSEGSGPGVQ